MFRSNQIRSVYETQIDELSDGDFSCSIADISVTCRNGHFPEQGVSVQYLPENQKLKIPGALGMSWSPTTIPNLCHTNQTLYSRFWKVASMSYTEIESLLKTKTTALAVQEVIDGLGMITPVSERPLWETTEADSDLTFRNLSKKLQFNCDIRDFGYLLTENATVSDTAWSGNVENVPRARLENKLSPYTLEMIAALNHSSVGNYPLGAWVRAFGLGVGIYPARGSAFSVQAMYTTRMPSMDDLTATRAFDQSHGEFLMTICGNILAVFGIFHLNKNHTYIRGNEGMERCGSYYLETIRAPDSVKMLENMMLPKNKESLLRIAPFPFGLAQTYWFAKVLYKHQLLMPALVVRYCDLSPPPVQRIMVILRAASEWDNFPRGRDVSRLFSDKLARLKTQADAIKADPPRYSDLYRFYGCEEKMKIPDEVWSDVKALRPATYGFAMVAHVTEDGKLKDGIALARCLMSVERDMKSLGTMWKNVWRKEMQERNHK